MSEARATASGGPEPSPRGWVDRAAGADGFALRGAAPADDVALAWAGLALPLLGFGVGLGVRALVVALEGSATPFALAGVAASGLWLLGGRGFARTATAGFGRAVAAAAALLLLGVELALFSLLGSSGTLAMPLAGLLGRWALVVLAYGSQPAPGDDVATRLVKQLGFNQFAVASVSAMALTLLLVDAIGLLLLFAVATQTIALRIVAHSRRGGVTRSVLGAGAALGELTTLMLSAALVGLRSALLAVD